MPKKTQAFGSEVIRKSNVAASRNHHLEREKKTFIEIINTNKNHTISYARESYRLLVKVSLLLKKSKISWAFLVQAIFLY